MKTDRKTNTLILLCMHSGAETKQAGAATAGKK